MGKWTDNDLYLLENLIGEDAVFAKTLAASRESGLQEAEVSPAQGKFLYLLARIKNAKRILELGTLGGYSAIWLARALPRGGVLISLEYSEVHARTARKNIENAGLSDKIRVIQGAAADSLNKMIADKEEPFDMIFIDADKPNYSLYLELTLRLSKPGTLIYSDNVIRNGELCNAENPDPSVRGVREFIGALGKSAALESTALQTVGIKGYDGFTLSVVV